jgi:MFS superfamily sulfate permease-like transporter
MQRPIHTVALESLLIGSVNAVLIYMLTSVKLKLPPSMVYLLAGALIHILFEYSDMNRFWCETTYQKVRST